jgi:cysteine-rich repeat protein
MRCTTFTLTLIVFSMLTACDWFDSTPVNTGDADGDESPSEPSDDPAAEDWILPDASDPQMEDADIPDLADVPDEIEPEPECVVNGDCDDSEPCNGQESCDVGTCVAGLAPAEGTPCTSPAGADGACAGGLCIPFTCGDGDLDDGEECDDGNRTGGDGCESNCTWTCETAGECDDTLGCTMDMCDLGDHTCSNLLQPAGTVCRPLAGSCDVVEVCDGTNAACPTDGFEPASLVCRASVGVCDLEELCPGDGPACPGDAVVSSGTACNDGNPCTYPDQCDGAGACLGTPSGLHDVQAIDAGNEHSCVLMPGGAMKCWGYDYNGQCGDGVSSYRRMVPVNVVGLSPAAVAVSTGSGFSCALTTAGGIKCWGHNFYGQLGEGSTTSRFSPTNVVGLTSGVTSFSANFTHSCAITGSGVYCWGTNSEGQLGDGTTTSPLTPVQVGGGLPVTAAAVSTGDSHTCGLTPAGSVACWGGNDYGQLGDGTTTNRLTPVSVIGLGATAAVVSAGGHHTCVLSTGGAVRCWGYNGYGQLGDGTTTSRPSPGDVTGLPGGIVDLCTGQDHTCVALGTGEVYCWGRNNYGQIGDGTTVNRSVPTAVVDLAAPAVDVACEGDYNDAFTCAILADTSVMCWGYNTHGELGNNTTTDSSRPVAVLCP